MPELRLPFYELSSAPFKGILTANAQLEKSPLGKTFIELIYLRISQINGCAYCLELHSKNLRAAGEATEKLDSLAGWRVSPHFTERERAALAWTDSVTHIAETAAPDEVYLPLKEHFSDQEISDLTMAIAVMNAMNRIAVAMRK